MNKKEDKDQLWTVTQEEEQEQELEITRKEKNKNGNIKKLLLSDKITIEQPDQTNRSNRNPRDSASHSNSFTADFFIQQQHQPSDKIMNKQSNQQTKPKSIHSASVTFNRSPSQQIFYSTATR